MHPAAQGLPEMNLRSALFVFGALLVGINVLSAIWDLRNERRVVERNALRDFNNLTSLLTDQTARSLESTDLVLTNAANNINSNGLGDIAARTQRLKDRISAIPQIRAILLLDRHGQIIGSTDERSEIGADYSERTYFTKQRDSTAWGRYVSEPFLGKITGRWAFAVSEPYMDEKGRFDGVVAAIMDVGYFDRLYRSLEIGDKGFVALVTEDGVLVTRVPGDPKSFGKRLPDPRGVREVVRQQGRYSGWNQSALTDPPSEVLVSAAKVPGAPFTVAVGAPEATVLAPWRTEAARVVARTILTSAVMLALVVLAARELARRAEADSRTRESEKRYAHAVAGANDGIWEYDVPAGRVYFSARALELMGVDPKLEGFRPRDEWEAMIAYHEEDAPERLKSIQEHMAGNDLYYHREWRVRRADGNYHWVMIRGLCVRDADGRPLRYAGSLTDIEPRKRYEAQILRQTALLDELFESAPEAVALLALDGRVIRINREFTSLFGFTAEESAGRLLGDLIVPKSERGAWNAATSGRVMVECERIRKDGSRLQVELTASPVTMAGETIGIYSIYRDITERSLAEAEKDRLQARLRQAEKMEAVGRLAGGIAHDFNNVLGGILGYGEMLAESAAQGSPEQRYSRNLLIAANRARDLVDQILTYSRSQRAPRGPVEIGRIVAETLEVIRGSIPADIVVDVDLPTAPLVVYGDPTQLHQVVMNLFTNAVHAMSGKGTLAVSLQALDLDRELKLVQATLMPGTYVRLTVGDTGAGMNEATLARIFEPFFTTKEVGRGTGLGLSLVYGIVADSGGATHVTSEVGRGSTFEIYLPRTDTQSVAAAPAEGPLERGHGERILLVDDEKPLLIMTAELLTRLGYEPVPFSDPRSALASLQAMPQEYDLVLTDEMMPGLTGTALARGVREAHAGMPIILISGYTGPVLTQMALAAGAKAVLKKPVQSRELAAALARALAH